MSVNSIDALCEEVLREAKEQDLMIATAESCTGGLLAAALTDIEGYSHVFERGFVCYSEPAKSEMLGVPAHLIEQHGAVSEEVARFMAEGALHASGAQLALAITGFAGPGEANEEEGLVHIAAARAGEPVLHMHRRFGARGRDAVREAAVIAALELGLALMRGERTGA